MRWFFRREKVWTNRKQPQNTRNYELMERYKNWRSVVWPDADIQLCLSRLQKLESDLFAAARISNLAGEHAPKTASNTWATWWVDWLLFTSLVSLTTEQFKPKWSKYKSFPLWLKTREQKQTVGVIVWPTEPHSRRGGQGGIDELEENGNGGKKQPASRDFVFMVLGKLNIFPRHDTILIALSGMRTISVTNPF